MRHILLILVVLVFATAVRGTRLDIPSRMIFDEIYYAKAAKQYLARQEITEEITHPPLSKLVIAAAIWALGDRAVGWRAASAAAGVLLVLLVALLAWELTHNPFVAAASSFLVAIDGLAFVESRIAKPDIFIVLFLVTSYWTFWRHLRGAGVGWLYLSGLAAGAALSTKWTGVAPLGTIPLFLIFLFGQGRWRPSRGRAWLHLAGAYLAVPAAVYLLTWIPYFAMGHSVREWLNFHAFMFRFHAGLTAGHPYQSPWWSWPLLLRPIWYEFEQLPTGFYRGVLAIGNPALWWAAIPAMIYLARAALRRRDPVATFIVTGFLVSYLPYIFIGRALFLYHMLPAIPFMAIAVAVAAAHLRARLGPAIPLLYLVIGVAWFVAYYPVLAALPIATARFYRLMWFGTWL
ncbi:MAG TPA: phospholipid carrier-dependent glycosyltransferase [bacterium]|jgi:dolichyl-phosphate-mannose--protein O-mannosyl transferase|nr:phospholipid carrier-dependent glycosyltransferase [bacterium]